MPSATPANSSKNDSDRTTHHCSDPIVRSDAPAIASAPTWVTNVGIETASNSNRLNELPAFRMCSIDDESTDDEVPIQPMIESVKGLSDRRTPNQRNTSRRIGGMIRYGCLFRSANAFPTVSITPGVCSAEAIFRPCWGHAIRLYTSQLSR